MTHVKALQAGHSSQGTSEPITPAPNISDEVDNWHCRPIQNGQKFDRNWISDIQNGRRPPFSQTFPKNCKTNSHKNKNCGIDLKYDEKWFFNIQNGCWRPFFLKTFTKKVARMIWTMFKPTAGWLQFDINLLLVNIYTCMYVWNEGIYIVFAILVEGYLPGLSVCLSVWVCICVSGQYFGILFLGY